jgi:hypothetical protein
LGQHVRNVGRAEHCRVVFFELFKHSLEELLEGVVCLVSLKHFIFQVVSEGLAAFFIITSVEQLKRFDEDFCGCLEYFIFELISSQEVV